MKRVIKAPARLDRVTKNLVKRLKHGEIAIICHEDIDMLAARELINAGVVAVINALSSATGNLPPDGVATLISCGIPVIDEVGEKIFEVVQDGDIVLVNTLTGSVECNGVVFNGKPLTESELAVKTDAFSKRVGDIVKAFVENTIDYIQREGVEVLTARVPELKLKTDLVGKHVLIVVRGRGCEDDLKTIMAYVRDKRPVLIGVDGGADLLLKFGLKPDIVIGDMDSVSDRALELARDIVVHAYPDGRAPGIKRINELGLQASVLPVRGTSEDAAMLLAYAGGASLIVAVGTHTGFLEFLEKGRKGMASTFLVRLRVGHLLVDAKGVSQLYSGKLKLWHIALLLLIGAIIALVVVKVSPYSLSLLRAIMLWFFVRLEKIFSFIF
ncbi:MAG: hypothetical protein RUDDFDWM_000384 [Candidatus Fervidibacterota bacterium]